MFTDTDNAPSSDFVCKIYDIVEVVKYLYETCHARVETRSIGEDTALAEASRFDHLEVVKYLVETCNTKVTDDELFCATYSYNPDLIKYIKEKYHADK